MPKLGITTDSMLGIIDDTWSGEDIWTSRELFDKVKKYQGKFYNVEIKAIWSFINNSCARKHLVRVSKGKYSRRKTTIPTIKAKDIPPITTPQKQTKTIYLKDDTELTHAQLGCFVLSKIRELERKLLTSQDKATSLISQLKTSQDRIMELNRVITKLNTRLVAANNQKPAPPVGKFKLSEVARIT